MPAAAAEQVTHRTPAAAGGGCGVGGLGGGGIGGGAQGQDGGGEARWGPRYGGGQWRGGMQRSAIEGLRQSWSGRYRDNRISRTAGQEFDESHLFDAYQYITKHT
jgi:hypothetical protein